MDTGVKARISFPELHISRTYIQQSDMTVASTVDISVDKIMLPSKAGAWIVTRKALNAAGLVVYIEYEVTTTKPSWVTSE